MDILSFLVYEMKLFGKYKSCGGGNTYLYLKATYFSKIAIKIGSNPSPTTRSGVLLEKTTLTQLVKNFSTF
jgi:hypothetical protein